MEKTTENIRSVIKSLGAATDTVCKKMIQELQAQGVNTDKKTVVEITDLYKQHCSSD